MSKKPAPGSEHWKRLEKELFRQSDELSGTGDYCPHGLYNPRKRRDTPRRKKERL